MKNTLLIVLVFCCIKANCQLLDDVIRNSWFTQLGSARVQATGGVNASLGGDITSNHINPAGLGFYRTKEFVVSTSFLNNNNFIKYRGSDSANSKKVFNIGTTGFVFGNSNSDSYNNITSSAFAISFSQIVSFNNNISYKGFNNYSSFTEQYLEELVKDKADTVSALNNYIFGSSLAFRTFLIDTSGSGGLITGYRSLVPISTGVNQIYAANSTGGKYEIAVGGAANSKDKWYYGGSLVIPISSFTRELNYTEKDATNNVNNQFEYFNFTQKYSSNGAGIGAKLGLIYKPKEYFRLGFAFHTPQFMGFTDKIQSWMTANTENYKGTKTESSDALNSNNAGERYYTLQTPYKILLSASYVFREAENTKKQRAFLSADLEFVNYRGTRYYAKETETDEIVIKYYEQLNMVIKNYYKGNINFKIGGELKFDPFMIRAGAAYYGSPYNDNSLQANKYVASCGLGYRNHGIFIDVTYSNIWSNDINFAYRLADKANTFAQQNNQISNIMLTFGVKF
jgi:hypothetical protein